MKLFTTKSIETVKHCQEYFDFSLPSVLWAKRGAKFEVSFECFFCLCYNCLILLYCLLFVVYHVCLVNKDSQKASRSTSHNESELSGGGAAELMAIHQLHGH